MKRKSSSVQATTVNRNDDGLMRAKLFITRVYSFEQRPEAFHYVHKGMKTGNVIFSVHEDE